MHVIYPKKHKLKVGVGYTGKKKLTATPLNPLKYYKIN